MNESASRNSDPFTIWWSEHGNRDSWDYELSRKAWNAAIAFVSERGECHDAAEKDQGCFRAIKAENLLRRIAAANVIFPSLCANNTEAYSINDALAEYRLSSTERNST